MSLFRGTRLPLILGGRRYIDKVLSHGPIAYWPMNEPSGSVARCLVNSAQDGAYTGVTLGQPGIGDGNTTPFFDGLTDFNNIYTTTLRDAFNGGEGTIIIWPRVNAVEVWEDEAQRFCLVLLADASNRVWVRKRLNDNQLQWYYRASGTVKQVLLEDVATTDWFQMGITWSKTAGATGELKAYYSGIQTGTTQTGLGTWAGSISATQSNIGAWTADPLQTWHGWLAHGILWNRPLSAAAMLDLATL